MSAPLYTCQAKGTDREAGSPRRSENWAAARRGRFKVFPDRVELGDWCIPFEEVEWALLYRVPAPPFGKAGILEVETGATTYQFGFNPWAHPEKHFPMEVEEEDAAVGTSPFSIVIRLIAIGYLLYTIWEYAR